MKSLRYFFSFILITLFTLLYNQNVLAQKDFEGLIKYKLIEDDKISYLKYYSAFKKVRLEVENPKKDDEAVIIFNQKKHEMNILVKSEKTAISIPTKFDGISDEPERKKEKKESKINITKTNESKKILGYNAVKYIGKAKNKEEDKEEEYEVWITEEIKPFVGFGDVAKDIMPIHDAEGMEISGFPLEFYNKTKSSSIIVTSIEEKRLDESLFKIPSNYKSYDFKSLMKGIKNLTKDLSNMFKNLKFDNLSD